MPTKPDHGLRAVGVVWYREADWPRLRAQFADADKLPDTYPEWLASAEALLAQLRRDRIPAESVPLDPDTFSAWCAARGLMSLPRLGGHLRKVGSASTGKERWRNGSGAGSRRSTRARR